MVTSVMLRFALFDILVKTTQKPTYKCEMATLAREIVVASSVAFMKATPRHLASNELLTPVVVIRLDDSVTDPPRCFACERNDDRCSVLLLLLPVSVDVTCVSSMIVFVRFVRSSNTITCARAARHVTVEFSRANELLEMFPVTLKTAARSTADRSMLLLTILIRKNW